MIKQYRSFVSTTLNEKAVEKEESLKGETVISDAVRYARHHDRFDVLQRARLQRRVKAAPLKEIEFSVVQNAVVVEIADLEDARQRRLRFWHESLGLGVK